MIVVMRVVGEETQKCFINELSLNKKDVIDMFFPIWWASLWVEERFDSLFVISYMDYL